MGKKKVKQEKQNYKEILVSYVRHYRVKGNMTQKDVATCIGITEQRFASIETNKHKTNVVKCIKMAECLCTKLDNLYKLVRVTEEQYRKIRCINLDGQTSKELQEIYGKLDRYEMGESELSKDEINILSEYIRKNSVLRYGNVVESVHWKEIKKII